MDEEAKKSGPTIKRGSSKQDYQTPPAFLYAVQQFGQIAIDLAADGPNVCERWIGQGSPVAEDSFLEPWGPHVPMGNRHLGWLNPPFGEISRWARRCVSESQSRVAGVRIVMLTPAGLGTNWFASYVQPYALTLVLRPRLTFVGEVHPYPKDLAIHLYGAGMSGIGTWRWREGREP